jgi:hypothetical protein
MKTSLAIIALLGCSIFANGKPENTLFTKMLLEDGPLSLFNFGNTKEIVEEKIPVASNFMENHFAKMILSEDPFAFLNA